MPLLTAQALILAHSLTLTIGAFFLLVKPSTVLATSAVWIFSESMHIRTPSDVWTTTPSEPLATMALLVFLAALTQAFLSAGLTPISVATQKRSRLGETEVRDLGEQAHTLRTVQNQWMGLAGVRVLLMGGLVAWIYAFEGNRNSTVALPKKSSISLLANGAVFTFAMTDMLFWGYVWTVLREEGIAMVQMLAKLRDEDNDR